VQGPQGGFNIIDQPCDKALLLSGGSGITPLMSMTRWLYDTAAEVDLHFVHSARTPDDIIYHQELQAIDARAPNFRLSLVCEGSLSGATWSGYRGFLDAAMLQQMVPDLFERTIYVCGPESYMGAVRGILQGLDFPMQRYFEESFGGAPAAAPAPVDAGESATHRVSFSRAGKSVSGVAEETILDIAGKHGLWIPSACRMGFCGACKLRRVSGEVRMNHSGGISDTEINDGYVLACCSYAQGDVEFDY
jgi:ferredoxin-NADP reductase